ncbi:MAG: glucosaminidase domain-containing protein [Bacteroidota bacterium]
MLKFCNILFLFIICPLTVLSENTVPVSAAQLYVQNFKDDAIKEMAMYNIPASITLAQGMLESGFGTSDLAVQANNHFGIKCHDEWNGPTFIKTDDEKDECFRKYSTVLDSYTDHSLFLKSRARYAQLFELNPTDYRGWAKGLKENGYATDPKYTDRLLELIEAHELFKYDLANQPPRRSKTNSAKKETKSNATITVTKKEEPLENATITNVSKGEKKAETNSVKTETREILRLGIVKYIVIKPNDTFSKIAKETDKDLWQLYKFNDLSPESVLVPGQRLFLQPKNKKAKEPFHIVKKGDTMKSISQLYGIKLTQLYKKNNMMEWEEPVIGQQLYMRERKK